MSTGFDPIEYLRGRSEPRFLLGLAGVPGAGKSTLAAWLAERLDRRAVVVGLDGFHRRNAELAMRGLLDRKGAPDTYDVAAFVKMLKRIRAGESLLAPAYCRRTHEPEPNTIRVGSEHRIVIVEGNYLLQEDGPWADAKPLLDEVWYVDADPETTANRLIARHLAGGRSQAEAEAKVRDNDGPNGRLVEQSRAKADRWIDSTEAAVET